MLVLAVCAVSARFSSHPDVSTEPAFLRGEPWAKSAREIALRRYDEPSITILTVYLILGLHEFGTCQGGRSWMFCGMAMRMAYALQLHREAEHDPLGRKNDKSSQLSPTDREIRRRTMWACFLMDRFNSSGTERPSIALEAHIKVQLPIKEAHFQMEISGPTEDLQGNVHNPVLEGSGQVADPQSNMGVAAYLIKVIALWGRVVRYLNLGGKENDPHPLWHPESQFAELKQQIKDFSDGLPDRLVYTPEALQSFATQKLANQFLYLHISYHQTVLFLHKFAIPAAPGSKPSVDMPKDFSTSSAKTAIEAASQISSLMSEAIKYVVAAPFAGYCAFASSTVHVWGIFSANSHLEATSKRDLTLNVKYLTRMKRHWGMFHHMIENLKSLYRQFADWAYQGPTATATDKLDAASFQYGDWFDKYPHGVSGTDYEDPAVHEQEESSNAPLSQKSDLQSVEDFFQNNPSAPTSASQQRKIARRQGQSAGRAHITTKAPTATKAGQANANQGGTMPHQSPRITDGHAVHDRGPQSLQHPLISNIYPLYSPSFYPEVQDAGASLYPPGQHFPVTELDRHLVLGAYAQDLSSTQLNPRVPAGLAPQIPSEDPNTTARSVESHNSAPTMSSLMWNQPTDFNLTPVGAPAYEHGMQSSAWFMPFNLVPPGITPDDAVPQYGPGISEVDGGQTFDVSHADGQ